tara:strand:+ start:14518 stop:15513 length:996 start_codon:yes stop_codon:yes gene_type:complete
MTTEKPSLKIIGNGISRDIHSQVLLSPLAGVSDQIFRGFVRRWAPDALLFTEMVNAKSLTMGFGQIKVEEISKELGPTGVQLFDFRIDSLVEAAQRAEDAGAYVIDINMGCPVRKIARKGGGSALLKEPNHAANIVEKVSSSVKIPVTVKTRLGWCEKSSNPESFAVRIQNAGAKLLTLHARTRSQGFSGSADWDAIRRVKKILKIPLIANGDISSPETAILCLKRTQADGVMVGRGCLGSPWLIGQIDCALKGKPIFETPCAAEKIRITIEHLNLLVDKLGHKGLLIARKHMNWTCNNFDGANNLRSQLVRAKTYKEAIEILNRKLDEII